MLKLYKDLSVAYYISAFSGMIALVIVSTFFGNQLIGLSYGLFWALCCAIFLNKIAIKRFKKMLSFAEKCNVNESLNRLYGYYKGNLNSKMDFILATHISSLLIHLGKTDLALKLLLQYNPEALMKRKVETVYRYSYYQILTVCYSHLDRKQDAVDAFKKSDELFKSPHFNKKIKPIYEIMHKANYLIITDAVSYCEEILSLLNEELTKHKNLLSEVSCRFSIVKILAKNNRLDEASEHIDFIKENGGDTVYAKCALNNNYSDEFLKENNLEKWEPTPIKVK